MNQLLGLVSRCGTFHPRQRTWCERKLFQIPANGNRRVLLGRFSPALGRWLRESWRSASPSDASDLPLRLLAFRLLDERAAIAVLTDPLVDRREKADDRRQYSIDDVLYCRVHAQPRRIGKDGWFSKRTLNADRRTHRQRTKVLGNRSERHIRRFFAHVDLARSVDDGVRGVEDQRAHIEYALLRRQIARQCSERG